MSKQWWDEQRISVDHGGYCEWFEENTLPSVTIYRESYEVIEDEYYASMFTEEITVTAKPKWYGRA
ncbi:hypothetical protein [Paenibacillus alvei]|uniref:Uncharacterized protein n=1 Tax=Paenibacillus alvei TaxID=44250 RepID=A0A383RDT0_PAEAL|nr:hypothetical protein [Paenibacillus alvei]SYX84634.1 protein of unknown function [Paenibacillus alvei]